MEGFCCGFFFFFMHTSHYPKLTTLVNRYARAATLQIPFCAFCLPGHPDTSFMTALETLGHTLPLMHAQTPSNADHQLPRQIELLPAPFHLVFFGPQQVSFHGKLESHVGMSLSLSLHAGEDV